MAIREEYVMTRQGRRMARYWNTKGATCLIGDVFAARFWTYVEVGADDECWPWSGGTAGKGYGVFYLGPDMKLAYSHRIVYALAHGEIGPDVFALHHCDYPPCCNPRHLFLGTTADNSADMARKGRSTIGIRNPQAKLTDAQVDEIAELYEQGYSQREVAQRFGVSQSNVSSVLRGATWKDAGLQVETRPFDSSMLVGEKGSNAKLTWEQVRQIRRSFADGEPKLRLSAKFGVSRRTIARIVNGETWKEATPCVANS